MTSGICTMIVSCSLNAASVLGPSSERMYASMMNLIHGLISVVQLEMKCYLEDFQTSDPNPSMPRPMFVR